MNEWIMNHFLFGIGLLIITYLVFRCLMGWYNLGCWVMRKSTKGVRDERTSLEE